MKIEFENNICIVWLEKKEQGKKKTELAIQELKSEIFKRKLNKRIVIMNSGKGNNFDILNKIILNNVK